MVKYDYDFKVNMVNEYLEGRISFKDLAKKYNIKSPSVIERWVYGYQENGLEHLKIKHKHRFYSQEFKLKVVQYYRQRTFGFSELAAKFNISESQVYSWNKNYEFYGINGLKDKSRGRPSTMPKKNKTVKNSLPKTKEQEYQEKIAELEAKLYWTNLELDVEKKLNAVDQKHRLEKKRK